MFDQQERDTSLASTSVRQENDALSTGQGDNSASPGSAASGSASSGSGADSSLSTVENTGSSADQNAADTCMVTMLQKGISNPKKLFPGMIRYAMLTSTGEPEDLDEALKS
jgi:hypothetical protein